MKMVAVALLAIFLAFPVQVKAGCDSCGDDSVFVNLPPSCIHEVELVVQNSLAYGSQDIKKVLPYVRKANKHFYKCENYDIAVGNDITVIVDRDRGVVYLSRYIFLPQEGER